MSNKKIEIVADNLILYQFLSNFIRQEKGEFFYEETLNCPCIKGLPVNFPLMFSHDIFDIIEFGGWNDCPPNDVLKKKSKQWYEHYGAELVKVSRDTLCYKCNVTDEVGVKTLLEDIIDFCPSSLDMYKQNEGYMEKQLLTEQTFMLWWD